ncbi:MAG TPA: rhomboid family intramembrane serine protease [Pyrinomonadaceae bacterium]|nr:rhomboid family intramembrane serine protease [Pyrinomonadaceae bacterium]
MIISVNLLAWFAVAWAFGLSPFARQHSLLLLRAGAVNSQLLGEGQWWRLLTSQFLHVNFPHMPFNMLALFLLGGMLERDLGAWRFLTLYFVSGLVGQLSGVAATPALISSGASQAVMGLAGAVSAGLLLQRHSKQTARLLILLILISVQAGLDLLTAGHIKAGHWGGFLAGAFVGYLFYRRKRGA